MATKPFSLQSPEDIAKEYGGNKQAIGRAMQMGLLDPTSAVLAGMFIDRVRNAAVEEQMPKQTIAQQVLPTTAQPAAMQPPQQTGVNALPVAESMYGENSFAGGGIVAFAGPEGSFVESSPGFYQLESEMPQPALTGLTDYISAKAALRSPYRMLSQEEQDYMNKLAPPTAEQKSQSRWLRALEAGLGVLGGDSPYALTNIGKGPQAALKGYAEDVKEERKQELAASQAKAELARRKRQEAIEDIAAGEKAYESAQDRENKLAIARIPGKEIQAAEALMKENPKLSFLGALSSVSQAMSPKDTYNATRAALTKAAEIAEDKKKTYEMYNRPLFEKAAKGDAAAIAKIKAKHNEIERDTFKLFQVEGISLSGGKLGSAPGGGGGRGAVDTSNPLLQ